MPISISESTKKIDLVYVDDLVSEFIRALLITNSGFIFGHIEPKYSINLGELAEQIYAFKNSRINLVSERVGKNFIRALYATYISYLPVTKFSYDLPKYGDERGIFVEMLKTLDSGQFSFFTTHPGITRGGHYHHTKTEKFLVVKGDANFRFRHILTDQTIELVVSGNKPQIVETIPGWTHDITNIGEDEMIVMLWANEIFDRVHPDTITCKV
jgi:UDP-2-acetamido-2,6-beta-L-arabino-hexul-4-ose reductase